MRNRRLQVHMAPPSSWKRAPLDLPGGPKHEFFRVRLSRLVEGSGIYPQMAALLTMTSGMGIAFSTGFPGFHLRRVFELIYPEIYLKPKPAKNETGLVDEAVEAFGMARHWKPEESRAELIAALVREAQKQKLDRAELAEEIDAAWGAQEGESDGPAELP